jgi:hypothetical protein
MRHKINIPEKELLKGNDSELSDKFNVSVKTVQRWKVHYGLRTISKRLTDREVEEIRTSKSTAQNLAKKYKKTLTTIYRIKNNITYKKPIICSGTAEIELKN